MAIKFDCYKKGHTPMEGLEPQMVLLAGYIHVGHVCAKCKVPFFELISGEKVDPAGLVDASGKNVIITNA